MSWHWLVVVTIKFPLLSLLKPYTSAEEALENSKAVPPELTTNALPAEPNAGTSLASVTLKLDKVKVPYAINSKVSLTEAPVARTTEFPEVAVTSVPTTILIPFRKISTNPLS